MKTAVLFLTIALLPPVSLAAQAAVAPGKDLTEVPVPGDAAAEPSALPRGFRGIELGMGKKEVEDILSGDDLFFYRGEPDVTILDRPNETLIEVSGLSYVRRAFFQFKEDKLFIMIFTLNESKMDHYSVYTQFARKYGNPATFSPNEAVWTDETVRVSVERPLAVKYVDLGTWNKLLEAGTAKASYGEIIRKDFLDGF